MFFFPFFYSGNSFWIYVISIIFIFLAFRILSGRVFRTSNRRTGSENSANLSEAFFKGAFSMLAKIASADGEISEQAKRKIEYLMSYELGLDQFSSNHAVSVFNAALSDGRSFESYADEFYYFFSSKPDTLQLIIDFLYRIAMADGKISPMEDSMFFYAVRRFEIPESVVNMIKSRYGYNNETSSSMARYYAVLGISENADENEIKKAYRKLIMEFHPDTVEQSDVGEDFKKYAKKRFNEIQQAYEKICKERGIK